MIGEMREAINLHLQTLDHIQDTTTLIVQLKGVVYPVAAEELEDEVADFFSGLGYSGVVHCTRTSNDTTFEAGSVQADKNDREFDQFRSEDWTTVRDWDAYVREYFNQFSPDKTRLIGDCNTWSPEQHFICCRPANHDGPHIAWSGPMDLCAVWDE